MSWSTKTSGKTNNAAVAQQAPTMLAHGTFPKGSSEQLGLPLPFKISAAVALVLAIAVTLQVISTDLKVTADKFTATYRISDESKKARVTSYKQNKQLGTIFVNAMSITATR